MRWYISVLFALCFYVPNIFAQTTDTLKDPAPDQSWHISADEIEQNRSEQTFSARGNVIISKLDRKITADFVKYDTKTKTAMAKGNVVVTLGGDVLSADRLDLDLNTETGIAYTGTVFLTKEHFYIRGNALEKVGPGAYRADVGSATPCDGKCPDWSIHGKNVRVTIEGYGRATHATFRIRDVPILYTPYLIFPVKRERQTGLISPRFTFSDRNGFQYQQPFFWAISDHADATFFYHYLADRGHKYGAEFRYALTEDSRGTLMYDYLNDTHIDDGSEDATKNWGYDHDRYDRPNAKRYWFRMKLDQALFFDMIAKLDLDYVSDQDYLREFKSGRSGLDESDRYFFTRFGRDLDVFDDITRRNSLIIDKRWYGAHFSTGILWDDHPVFRRDDLKNSLLQSLPFAAFSISKQQIFDTPLYWSLGSDYTYYYRQDGNKNDPITRAHRAEIIPELFLPMRAGNFFTFEPFINLRETYWNVSEYEAGFEEDETRFNRYLFETGARWSSEVYRLFDSDLETVDKIKHLIRPDIQYSYIPEKDQEDLPRLVAGDRINERSAVTYSLTNTLIAKVKKKDSIVEKYSRQMKLADEAILANETLTEEEKEAQVDTNALLLERSMFEYRQVMRFYLSQSYDFFEAKTDEDTDNDPEPFSSIYGRFDLTPFKHLRFNADARWNQYVREFDSHNIGLRLEDDRGDWLFFEHRTSYLHNRIESTSEKRFEKLYISSKIQLTGRLYAYGAYEYDNIEKERVLLRTGIGYNAQCWGIYFDFLDANEEKKFTLMFDLFKVGKFDTGFSQTDSPN